MTPSQLCHSFSSSRGKSSGSTRLPSAPCAVGCAFEEVLSDARFYTSEAPEASIGLCTMEVPGVDADELQRRLRTRHGVLVQSLAGNARAPEIRGIRVTPNVFTSLRELDRLVVALTASVREARRERPAAKAV